MDNRETSGQHWDGGAGDSIIASEDPNYTWRYHGADIHV